MSEGTTSEDYSISYYRDAHLGGVGDYNWDSEHWRTFFRMVADRVVGIANPASVLDVGCARGLLVQALREKAVDASGFDVSEHAIDSAHPEVRDHLWVASATAPIEGRYSLITCIEVLEHMSPVEAQLAMDRICEASDLVLFSSSPSDHQEPTHINVRGTDQWAAWFAERGFFRRTDVDVSFLTSWAVLFERRTLTVHALAQRYEQQYTTLNIELVEKRQALLEAYRQITRLDQQLNDQASGAVSEQVALVQEWEGEVLEARHQLLTMRDHVVGTEAEVGRLKRDNARLQSGAVRARKQTQNVRGRLKKARVRNRRLMRQLVTLKRDVETSRARPSLFRRGARKLVGGRG